MKREQFIAAAPGCTLNGRGLQTNKHIRCTVTPERGNIIVRLYGHGADNMVDDGYRRGQKLFTATRTPRGIRTAPRTATLFRKVG